MDDTIEIPDDAPSIDELLTTAEFLALAARRRSIEPVAGEEEAASRDESARRMGLCAARLRETAGYCRRRDAAAELGDVGQVDELTERIALVSDGFDDDDEASIRAALDMVQQAAVDVEAAGDDGDDGSFAVEHDDLGLVVIAEASHSQLDTLIEELGLEDVDVDGDRILAATVDADGEPVNMVGLNSPDKRVMVEAAIIEQQAAAGDDDGA